ncbi:MAG: hypothetical protein RJA22_695 [Verrucomicrobiota bacterium]
MTNQAMRNPAHAIGLGKAWLPDMDLNHDKQIQSLLCYRYTIGQCAAPRTVGHSPAQSSSQLHLRAGAACF